MQRIRAKAPGPRRDSPLRHNGDRMTNKIVVLSACASEEEALKIARALVDARLAACANIVPGARSIYRWKGVTEDAREWLLIIKSRRDLFEALGAELRRLHSYELPELVAVPIIDGSAEYLGWLDAELGL